MTLALAIERTLGPLDEARRAWLRLVSHSRFLSTVLAKREHRLALMAGVHAPVAFALAIYFPVPLFVLAPILFGVLHVAADVRYLILRRTLSRFWVRSICGFSAALIVLQLSAVLTRTQPELRLELSLGALFALFAVFAAGARTAPLRAGAATFAIVVLGALSLAFPAEARLALLHGHNLVAFLLLFLVFPSHKSKLLAPLLALSGFALALASGAFYGASLGSSGVRAFHLHLFEVADWVAPGLRADFAIGLTTAFLFLQSAHYLIWLALVPQREQRSQGTLTFRMSFRALLADFGPWGLTLVGALALLVLAGAAFDAPRTQRTYLSLGTFHAYLELAMLVYFWVRREAAAR